MKKRFLMYFVMEQENTRKSEGKMNKKTLNIVTAFWLIIITPILGILPIVALLPLGFFSRSCRHLTRALIGDIAGLFINDPAPDVMDAWPPVTDFHLGVIGFMTFGVACFLIYASRKAKKRS